MTIDEAITDLSIQLEVKRKLGKDHQANAVKLGSEALKREKHNRLSFPKVPIRLLPSETKD